MAKRLQTVLQRPLTPAAKATKPAPEEPAAPIAPALPQGKPLPPSPGKTESSSVDSLEEEMARLLGRTDPGRK
jgi:hypothetical protein